MIKGWVKRLWLRSQGVPEWNIFDGVGSWDGPPVYGSWRTPYRCVICGKKWRPDRPEYIAVYGKVHEGSHGLEWSVPESGIYGIPIGKGWSHIQYICTNHRDRWESVVDCHTAQGVEMRYAPSRFGS